MKFRISLICALFFSWTCLAQQDYIVELEPMPGHFTDTTEQYWFLLRKADQKANNKSTGRKWKYYIDLQEKRMEVKEVSIRTEPLLDELYVGWMDVRRFAPSIQKDTLCFLTGSCAFQYPFPLNVGGKRRRLNRIFAQMAKEEADFMVWTGDNVYYLAGQWNSYKKMVKKNLRSRYRSPIDDFLASCPQYAIWDDHDYGPNDSDGRFKLKDTALTVFKRFWANPYYGTNGKDGVFCHFSHQDCDFFLLDSRFHCNKNKDERKLLGEMQIEWLKEKLLASKANFKFIFSGTQFLPVEQSGETWGKFGTERNDFLRFLRDNEIIGVIFVSGDRHYSELNKEERDEDYPLYEFTCSPLTSFLDPSFPKNNPLRVENTAIRDQNYGRIKIYNDGAERTCLIETFNTKGELVWKYEIQLSDLK